MADNPWRDAFYNYAKTRRGLSTVNYAMIEAMMKRAGLFSPPAFTESTLQREFRKVYGMADSKEFDFQGFEDVCKKVICILIGKAKNISPEEAFKQLQSALMEKQPKSVNEKII